VVFLDKDVTRAWLADTHLRPYRGKEKTKHYSAEVGLHTVHYDKCYYYYYYSTTTRDKDHERQTDSEPFRFVYLSACLSVGLLVSPSLQSQNVLLMSYVLQHVMS